MATRDEYKINEERMTKRAETPRQRKNMVVEANTLTHASELFNNVTEELMELSYIKLPETDREEQLKLFSIMLKAKSVIDDAGELILESCKRLYEAYDIAIDEDELGFRSSRGATPYGRRGEE